MFSGEVRGRNDKHIDLVMGNEHFVLRSVVGSKKSFVLVHCHARSSRECWTLSGPV